jgi:hypothetical protein
MRMDIDDFTESFVLRANEFTWVVSDTSERCHDVNIGGIRDEGSGVLQLVPTLPVLERDPFRTSGRPTLDDRLVIVQWSHRQFAIPIGRLADFADAIRSEEWVELSECPARPTPICSPDDVEQTEVVVAPQFRHYFDGPAKKEAVIKRVSRPVSQGKTDFLQYLTISCVIDAGASDGWYADLIVHASSLPSRGRVQSVSTEESMVQFVLVLHNDEKVPTSILAKVGDRVAAR